MTTFDFQIYLNGINEIDEDLASRIFEVGCDDSSPVSCDGKSWLYFHRDALTLEDAVHSAVSDLRKAGITNIRLQTDESKLIEKINGQLSTNYR